MILFYSATKQNKSISYILIRHPYTKEISRSQRIQISQLLM